MWRKQPEAKPSVATPSTRGSSYAPAQPAGQAPPLASETVPAAALKSPYGQPQAPSSDRAVLTPGIFIKGELTGKADLLIDGEVQGSIRLGESSVTIGQAGHVRADIDAAEIVVRGRVEGDLRGRDRVRLGDSCQVAGDLEAPRIAIEEGAQFKGRIEMGAAADARERQSKRGSHKFASPEPAPSVEVTENAPVGAGNPID